MGGRLGLWAGIHSYTRPYTYTPFTPFLLHSSLTPSLFSLIKHSLTQGRRSGLVWNGVNEVSECNERR